jgi:hypothetical protein
LAEFTEYKDIRERDSRKWAHIKWNKKKRKENIRFEWENIVVDSFPSES